jgi:hypothetical protein
MVRFPGDETEGDGCRLSLGQHCRFAGNGIVAWWTEEDEAD